MGLSAAELEARRTQLQAILFSPTRRVVFENGIELTYNSNAEISSAIAAIDALLSAAPRHLRLALRSGYR